MNIKQNVVKEAKNSKKLLYNYPVYNMYIR